MAIPILNHMDFQKVAEIQNVLLHVTSSASVTSPGSGQIIYDSGTVKYYNGSTWVALASGSGGEENQNAFSNIAVSGQTTVAADAKTDTVTFIGGSNVTITTNAGTDEITFASTDTNTTYSAGTGLTLSGTTFNTNVDGTQSVAANTSSTTAGRTYKVQVDASDNLVVNVPWADTNTVYTHPTQSAISASGTGATVVDGVTVNTLGHTTAVSTRALTLANLGYTGATDANNYSFSLADLKTVIQTTLSDLTIGAGTDTITIPGDLVVTGTTTTNNVQTVSTSNGVVFEGAAADNFDMTLLSVVSGSSKTVTLPNIAGYVPIMTTSPGTTAITATAAELNHVDGVTSNIQTQLNGKQATITGAATTITGSNLTTSRALVSDGSGKVAVSAVTSTELGLLSGLTTLSGNNTGDEVAATTSVSGIVELATNAETITGTDTSRTVTPAGVAAALDAKKYVGTIGDGTSDVITLTNATHGLGTDSSSFLIQLLDNSGYTVFADVQRIGSGSITFTFSSAPASGAITVLIYNLA